MIEDEELFKSITEKKRKKKKIHVNVLLKIKSWTSYDYYQIIIIQVPLDHY